LRPTDIVDPSEIIDVDGNWAVMVAQATLLFGVFTQALAAIVIPASTHVAEVCIADPTTSEFPV
jgi:hypothetical protein